MKITMKIMQYPCSVVITDADPIDLLESPEVPKTVRIPFGEGEQYATREEATKAARAAIARAEDRA